MCTMSLLRSSAWSCYFLYYSLGVSTTLATVYRRPQANGTLQPRRTPLKCTLNWLEIHEIGSVDTSESKQQNYDQI